MTVGMFSTVFMTVSLNPYMPALLIPSIAVVLIPFIAALLIPFIAALLIPHMAACSSAVVVAPANRSPALSVDHNAVLLSNTSAASKHPSHQALSCCGNRAVSIARSVCALSSHGINGNCCLHGSRTRYLASLCFMAVLRRLAPSRSTFLLYQSASLVQGQQT
jgi:hypothetical protein